MAITGRGIRGRSKAAALRAAARAAAAFRPPGTTGQAPAASTPAAGPPRPVRHPATGGAGTVAGALSAARTAAGRLIRPDGHGRGPLAAFGALAAADLLVAVIVLGYAFPRVDIDFNPATVAYLTASVAGGALIEASI
ncbi:hypothetical protein FNX44_017595, partial [Streptomyces sp. OF1]|nr:hypothetical protein [Streptomyces alkaliterrae]